MKKFLPLTLLLATAALAQMGLPGLPGTPGPAYPTGPKHTGDDPSGARPSRGPRGRRDIPEP